jgi:hypothetical protein
MDDDVHTALDNIGKGNYLSVGGNIYQLADWDNNYSKDASMNSTPTVQLYDPRTGQNFTIQSAGPNFSAGIRQSTIQTHNQSVDNNEQTGVYSSIWDMS